MIDADLIRENIPEQMQHARRWLIWQPPKKQPLYADGTPRRGTLDSLDDVARLADFETALQAAVSRGCGLGFALGPDGTGKHWQGIDFDHIDDHPGNAELLDDLQGMTYTERSPSGTGWHAIGYGRHFASSNRSRDHGIEFYAGGKFFTVTGDEAGIHDPVDLSDFVASRLLPIVGQQVSKAETQPVASFQNVSPETLRELRSALTALRADDRDEWISNSLSLKTAGEVARSLWLEWSQTSDKWRPEDARLWDSLKPKNTDYRVIFSKAQAAGWINPLSKPKPTTERPGMPKMDGPFSLAMFSLKGKSIDMEKQMLDDKFILDRLAILGQATVFYASRNAGKTLITLRMLIDAIEAGNVDPSMVFYINADDNYTGLVTKLKISERHGFHMLAPGHNGFNAEMLTAYMEKMIADGTARGCIIILDTLKKFADVMDKKRGSEFGKNLRQFVMHGGTVIALAHVNKHRDAEGKVVFSGTSDIPDDVDAVYTADVIEDSNGTRTVLFENQKNRGDNAQSVSYTYTKKEGGNYFQLLDSVRKVSEMEAERARKAKEVADRLDANRLLIEAISDAIANGTNTRTELIAIVHSTTSESKKRVTRALDDHTGNNLVMGHRWTCERGEKNARIYHLLNPVFGGKLENSVGYEKHGKFEKLNVMEAVPC